MPTVIRKTDSSLSVGERRRDVMRSVTWQVQVRASAWSPPADVYETEREYVVRVEAAGMREAEFEVQARYVVEDGRPGPRPA